MANRPTYPRYGGGSVKRDEVAGPFRLDCQGEAGGKVVWLGLPPMSLARDEAGQATAFERNRSNRILGVDFSGVFAL